MPTVKSIELYAATEDFQNNTRKLQQLFVFLEDGKPIILGSGRYALVLLASTSDKLDNAANVFAIKLLKKDPESGVFNRIGKRRFFEEAVSTRTFASKLGALVDYAGFGLLNSDCIAVDGLGLPRDEAIDKLCEQVSDASLNETIEKNAGVQSSIESAAQLSLQGPFMVLHAAFGTLDDLLIHKYPFELHPLIAHSKTRRDAIAELRASCLGSNGLPQFNKDIRIADRLAQSKDYSGFSILKEIGWVQPNLANKIVVSLFQEIVKGVAELHKKNSLAHRDLKPGNLLISFRPPETKFSTQLADLGFVADPLTAQGVNTIGGSSKEPGALAPGTFLFRAPEQLESGYEIHFEVLGESSKMIRFRAMGDMAIWTDDWFESVEVIREGVGERTDIAKCRVVSVKHEGNLFVATLDAPVRAKTKRLYYHGYITKMSGYHTDLFALGSMLYYFASGGKSPESFFTRCLQPIPDVAASADNDELGIYSCCLLLTIALCCEKDPAIVEAELGKLFTAADATIPDDVQVFLKYVRDVPAGVEETKSFGFRKVKVTWQRGIHPLHRDVHGYVLNLRRTPAIRYYLQNTNATPISAGLLYLIIRLMVRDRRFSFVNPLAGGLRSAEALIKTASAPDIGKAYWDAGLKMCSTKVLEEVQRLINKAPSCSYDKEYSALGETAKSWLLALRLSLDDNVVQQMIGSTPRAS